MAEKTKKARWKIPWLDFYIVRGSELSGLDRKIVVLEDAFKNHNRRILLEAKITEKLLHELSVLKGKIKAPECSLCGKPKIAAGIQWKEHPACKEKSQIINHK